MLVVTAALQVSEQIKDAGAYAGLASIVGLAVLSLLYFGQARELKRLRDWAGRAPERTAELQGHPSFPSAPGAPRRVVAQPVANPSAVRSPAQTPATAAGGLAGQPVSAAVAPVPAPPPRTAPGIPGAAPPAAAPRGPAAAGTSTPLGPAGPATPVPGAAAANGGASGQETQSIAAVDPGAPSTPTARGVPTPPYSPSVPPAVPSGAAAPPIAASPPFVDRAVAARQGSPLASRRDPGVEVWPPVDEESGGRPSGRTIATVFGTVTAVLLVALLASQLFGGPDADPVRTTSAPAASPSTDNEFVAPSGGSADAATPPVNPGDYAVYVLNGTQQNGIAAEVAKTLEADGYRSAGNAGNAANNTVTTTEVFYAEGKKPGAAAVAKTLEVDPANVKKLTRDIEVQGEGADVIVQIGADKATP